MLGDLPWYAWHVRRFPCEDVVVDAYKVDDLAFLFGQELGPDPHRLGFLVWAEGH